MSRRTPAQEGATHAPHGLAREDNPGPTMSRRTPAQEGATHASHGLAREGNPGPTMSRRTPAQEGATHAPHGLAREDNPGPTMSRRTPAQEGATHASHGLAREGNPGPTMSRRMPAQEAAAARPLLEVDSENAAPRLLEFQRLIPDSVGIAMRAADPADFLGWVRERLLDYAAPDSPLHGDTHLGRVMAFALAQAVWNGLVHCALSVNPERAKRKPMPEPGRNDPCPCGSGKKFQECCLPIPLMPPLTQDALWPYVLANVPQAERDELLSSSRIPRAALIEFAAHLLDMRRSAEVIAALEPRLATPERYHDEDTAILLHLLCEAYGMSPDGARRKLKLLRETTERAPRSPLRSEAWQRLATIYMDRGDSDGAWSAFRNAQYDKPQADEICVLEVELLVAGRRMDEAKQRAREWVNTLASHGAPEDDPRIEFLTRMAVNPLDPVTYKVQGAGGRLRDWLLRVAERKPRRHRLIPTATPARFALGAPLQLLPI